jgi:DNA-binding response OmpR family regulator
MSNGQQPMEQPAGPPSDAPEDETLDLAHVLKTFTHVPRVLIVEDTVELGEVIQATLQRMHIMAFCETHGLKALKRYEEIQPDLVLLDIGLPDMTGWKVLDAMKESKAIFRRPAIVVITAYGDPANRLMGKVQGVDSYLIKPFTPDEVQKVVQDVLGRNTKVD